MILKEEKIFFKITIQNACGPNAIKTVVTTK